MGPRGAPAARGNEAFVGGLVGCHQRFGHDLERGRPAAVDHLDVTNQRAGFDVGLELVEDHRARLPAVFAHQLRDERLPLYCLGRR